MSISEIINTTDSFSIGSIQQVEPQMMKVQTIQPQQNIFIIQSCSKCQCMRQTLIKLSKQKWQIENINKKIMKDYLSLVDKYNVLLQKNNRYSKQQSLFTSNKTKLIIKNLNKKRKIRRPGRNLAQTFDQMDINSSSIQQAEQVQKHNQFSLIEPFINPLYIKKQLSFSKTFDFEIAIKQQHIKSYKQNLIKQYNHFQMKELQIKEKYYPPITKKQQQSYQSFLIQEQNEPEHVRSNDEHTQMSEWRIQQIQRQKNKNNESQFSFVQNSSEHMNLDDIQYKNISKNDSLIVSQSLNSHKTLLETFQDELDRQSVIDTQNIMKKYHKKYEKIMTTQSQYPWVIKKQNYTYKADFQGVSQIQIEERLDHWINNLCKKYYRSNFNEFIFTEKLQTSSIKQILKKDWSTVQSCTIKFLNWMLADKKISYLKKNNFNNQIKSLTIQADVIFQKLLNSLVSISFQQLQNFTLITSEFQDRIKDFLKESKLINIKKDDARIIIEERLQNLIKLWRYDRKMNDFLLFQEKSYSNDSQDKSIFTYKVNQNQLKQKRDLIEHLLDLENKQIQHKNLTRDQYDKIDLKKIQDIYERRTGKSGYRLSIRSIYFDINKLLSLNWQQVKTLSITKCGLTDTDWLKLVEYQVKFQKFKNLDYADLSGNYIQNVKLNQLQMFNSLTDIDFDNEQNQNQNKPCLTKQSQNVIKSFVQSFQKKQQGQQKQQGEGQTKPISPKIR